MSNFLGVLGGMGPLATADFLRKLVESTPAAVDQEHIPILLYGDCTIPDRTASVIAGGASPLPQLMAGIKFLNQARVRAICIPCNSAHLWYEDIAAASTAPVLHIVRASAEQVLVKDPSIRNVGVLSTYGTHQMGIYRNTLAGMGLNIISPTDDEFDSLVSPGIALIKANHVSEARPLLEEAAAELVGRGASVIILGCTEIPIGMQETCQANPNLFVDSTEALALAVVEYFGYRNLS